MKKKLNILLCALSAAFVPMLFSCSNLFDSDNKDSSSSASESTAYITLGTPSYRTVIPSVSDSDFDVFKLTGAKAGEEESKLGEWDSVSSMKEASVAVSPGTWNFTLTADARNYYNGTSNYVGTSAYTGTIKNKEITVGSNSLDFTLSLSDSGYGYGSLSITLDYSGAENADKVSSAKGVLTDIDGTDVYISDGSTKWLYPSENNTFTFSLSDIPSGTYRAKITFYCSASKSDGSGSYEEVELATYRELVQISAGLTSTASRSIESFDEVYSITYNLNGGSLGYGTTVQESFTRKTDVIPLPVLTREYYNFAGWYTDESCSDDSAVPLLSPATDENSLPTYGWNAGTYTQNLTLYAKWTPVSFKITYELEDDNAYFDDERVFHTDEDVYYSLFTVETETFNIPIPKTTTDNKGFSYWSTNGGNYWSSYYEIEQIKKGSHTEDLTLYAYWGPAKYSITYILNNDDAALSENKVTTYTSETSTFNLPTPTTTDTSSMFYGWYTTETFDKDTEISQIENGSRGNITLYARWVRGVQASSIAERIKTMTASGAIKGIGAFSASTIKEINKALKELASTEGREDVLVTLDLSEVTGLTTLETSSFSGCTNLAGITLPDKLAVIEQEVFFGCTSLADITIPASVETIGDYAFSGCTSLESVTIPSGVTSIGADAFRWCSDLKSVYIADLEAWCRITFKDFDGNPLNNGAALYLNNSLLESLVIPSSITSINNYAFYNCKSISSVTIPDSVTSIGADAFSGCSNLTGVIIPNSVTSIGAGAFSGCSNLTGATIPDSVTSIGAGAFYGCSNLTGVIIIPDSVTSIGESVFADCTGLENLVIGKGVTSIGVGLFGCFHGCTSLASITIADGNPVYDSRNNCNAIIEKTTDKLILGCKDSVIPTGVKSIGEGAFYECIDLGNITIPDSVTSIGASAFSGCSNLTGATIPDSVTSIGASAFSGCTSLENITVPDSVMSIGENVFYNCSRLKNIKIGSGITSIPEGFFTGCSSLEEITVPFVGRNIDATEAYVDASTTFGYIFGNRSSLNTNETYNTNCVPATLKKVVVTGGNILEGSFSGCENIESITLPDKLAAIEQKVFFGCTSLADITIPASVESIGDYAFYGCTSLESIAIPASVESIGYYAFSGCTSLREITTGAESVRVGAFSGCTGLERATMKDTVKTIGEGAFSGCSSLEEITVPFVGESADNTYASRRTQLLYICDTKTIKKVTVTGGNIFSSEDNPAFEDCSMLTSIILPDSLTSLESYVFCGCTSLESIAIPDSVESIESYAFYNCTSLREITTGAESIEERAFSGCTGLERATMKDTVKTIGEGAFSGCSSLKEITVPFAGRGTRVDSDSDKFGYIFGKTNYTGSVAQNLNTNTAYYIPESLKKVTITGETLLSESFYRCRGLETIVIPNIKTIEYRSFSGCTGLADITIPSCVTSIGDYAFSDCTGLADITIPSCVTSIGDEAFSGCKNLKSVYITNLEAWLSISFSDDYANPLNNGAVLYLDNKPVDSLVISGSITAVKAHVFYGCSSITSVTIPDTVTSIGGGSFASCSNLASVTLSDSLSSIGVGAFANCASLENIEIPSCIASIGNNAFYGCKKLKSVYIENLEAWFNISFSNYSANPLNNGAALYLDSSLVETLEIPDSITEIKANALAGCTISKVTIPTSVTSIGDYAFYGCTNLADVDQLSGLTSIGDYAFYGCSSLESMTILYGVRKIGIKAFKNCTSLSEVTFCDGKDWYYTMSPDYINGTELSSIEYITVATAAEYLTATYSNYYWYNK